MKRAALLLSCEHATNRVPKAYQRAFASKVAQAALETHRGYDLGAKAIAHAIARELEQPSSFVFAGPLHGEVTRLLVDLNRSPRHPRVFSTFSEALTADERAELMARYYEPHHRRVRSAVSELLTKANSVLHIGVHSFTPELNGKERNTDVGLLYDPGRPPELRFADTLARAFRARASDVRVRRNYPYRGVGDGVTTMLRRELPAARYQGFELELNQGTLESRAFARSVVEVMSAALAEWLRS